MPRPRTARTGFVCQVALCLVVLALPTFASPIMLEIGTLTIDPAPSPANGTKLSTFELPSIADARVTDPAASVSHPLEFDAVLKEASSVVTPPGPSVFESEESRTAKPPGR